MICIEHVTVEYEKGIKALDDFSLMIKPGELIVLCGKSGCGKTTAKNTKYYNKKYKYLLFQNTTSVLSKLISPTLLINVEK